MPPRPAAPTNPWADLWNMYQGHSPEYFRTHPYKALVRGAAEIPSEVQRIATATPGTLRALGQLQMGERMAPAGPSRALQYVLQQADPTTRRTPQQTVRFHGSDFAAIPGAVGHYIGSQILDPQRLNQRVATEPISTASDLSAVLTGPEDIAKAASAGVKGLAARTGSSAIQDAVNAAAKSRLLTAPRAVTKAAARVGTAINPANVAARGTTAVLSGAKGTGGMFDATGAMTPRGVKAFQALGERTMPGKLTAADYADPHVQAHFAPVLATNGFRPAAFKEGVLSYNGAPTVRSQVTGVSPRAAAAPKTADLISQGRDAIDARVTSFAPGAAGQTADQIRGFANSKSAPNIGYTPADLTDLRLAAAGHDVLDAATAAKDPSLISQIGPPVGRAAWKGATTLGGLALGASAFGGHPLPLGMQSWLPEVAGAAGGFLFGKGTAGHGPGLIGQVAGGAQDWGARKFAGAGAPNWLDVPAWTKAAAAPAAAAPYLGQVGHMDLGTPPAPSPAAAADGSDPSKWEAPPPAYVPPDIDAGAPAQADQGAAPAPDTEAEPAPAKKEGHGEKPWSPPDSDLAAGKALGAPPPPAYSAPNIDEAPAAQAAGGRVEYAVGGRVGDMTEQLLRRAEQAQKTERTATKPLLGLSDDTVAQALRVAQRGI